MLPSCHVRTCFTVRKCVLVHTKSLAYRFVTGNFHRKFPDTFIHNGDKVATAVGIIEKIRDFNRHRAQGLITDRFKCALGEKNKKLHEILGEKVQVPGNGSPEYVLNYTKAVCFIPDMLSKKAHQVEYNKVEYDQAAKILTIIFEQELPPRESRDTEVVMRDSNVKKVDTASMDEHAKAFKYSTDR